MQTLRVRFHKSTIYTNLYGQDYVLVPSSVGIEGWCSKCAFENGDDDCEQSLCTQHRLHDEGTDLHYVDIGVLKSGA
jgi:hypothetical protein